MPFARNRVMLMCVVPGVAWIVSSCDVLGLGDDCTSDRSPVFTALFTDLTQIQSIVPLGTPSGGEIKDRHQIEILADTALSGATSGRNVPIVAPVRAKLESVRHFRREQPFVDEYYRRLAETEYAKLIDPSYTRRVRFGTFYARPPFPYRRDEDQLNRVN